MSHLHKLNNLSRGNKLSVHKPESFACWEAASQDGRPTLLPTFFIGSISLGHGASPGETIVTLTRISSSSLAAPCGRAGRRVAVACGCGAGAKGSCWSSLEARSEGQPWSWGDGNQVDGDAEGSEDGGDRPRNTRTRGRGERPMFMLCSFVGG